VASRRTHHVRPETLFSYHKMLRSNDFLKCVHAVALAEEGSVRDVALAMTARIPDAPHLDPPPAGAEVAGTVAALLAGRAAWCALGGRGRVHAVFQRSFYVMAEDGALACVGPPGLGAGPLNLLCAFPPGLDWPQRGLRPGAVVERTGGMIAVDRLCTIDLAGVEPWRPPRLPLRGHDRLHDGLACLAALAETRVPSEGIASLVPALARGSRLELRADGADLLLRIAQPAIAELRRALTEGGGAPRRGADVLLGLGPGLTPSGDDLVGGMLVALHALGRAEAAAALAAWALALASSRTGAISAAHLACAAAGEGALALHEMLGALVVGNDAGIAASLTTLAAIGHSSGWDMLAGAALVGALWRDGLID
jgi:hypothetical protein